MTDTRTPEQRARIMAAVRSKNTSPEIRVRRALYEAGVRGWRCHYRKVPGRPDLAWPSLRVALFVDGSFWHGHPSRYKAGRSGSYWDSKIETNVARDREVDNALQAAEWVVIRIWDFEVLKQLDDAVDRIVSVLASRVEGDASWQRQLRFKAAKRS